MSSTGGTRSDDSIFVPSAKAGPERVANVLVAPNASTVRRPS